MLNSFPFPQDFEQFPIGPFRARSSQNFIRWTSAGLSVRVSRSFFLEFIFGAHALHCIPPCAPDTSEHEFPSVWFCLCTASVPLTVIVAFAVILFSTIILAIIVFVVRADAFT
jgi:hypothetical protein